MFYKPQREQTIKIQNTLETLYAGIGGDYFAGEEAWNKLKEVTDFDLKKFFIDFVGSSK